MTGEIRLEQVDSTINSTASDSAQSQADTAVKSYQKDSSCLKKLDRSGVNLKFRGQRNLKEKGFYSERPEVLNKNLLRSIRRYLKEQYKSQKLSFRPFLQCSKANKRSMVIKYYTETIKNQSLTAQNMNQKDELGILHILTIFLEGNVSFRSDTNRFKSLKSNMNKLIQTYARKLFDPINSMPEFKKFIVILKEIGALAKIIESYPTLNKSKEAYKMKIEEIIGDYNQ